MNILGDLVVGIIGSFLASQLDALCLRWSEDLVRNTAKKLPPRLGSRFEEEWLAELEHQSGSLARIRYAASLWMAQQKFPRHVAASDKAVHFKTWLQRVMALVVAVTSGLMVTFFSIDLAPWIEKHVDLQKNPDALRRYLQFQDWVRPHLLGRPPLVHSHYDEVLNRPIVQNPIAQSPILLNPNSDLFLAIGSTLVFAVFALMIFFDRERENSRLIELGDLRRP